ncbi:adenine deaminase C-terminal domain-containing protein [Thermodesulfobacteriota bacterium]
MKRYSLLSVEGVEATKGLMNVALGKEKADLLIINAAVLNVYTGELLNDHSISIKGEWIVYVGDKPEDMIGPRTRIIDAQGKTVIPGLIDGHTHLADCLFSPIELLRYAMAGGTTTIITETIEPFPIKGYKGVVDFLDSLKDQPIKVFATAPAMASISKSISVISQKTLNKLLLRDDILGLGESYWQAVIQKQDDFLPIFIETLKNHKKLEGHSAGAKGTKLMAYILTGVSSCHESINSEEVLERLRLGLFVMVREGSIRSDLSSISKIKDADIDLRRLILVTDGVSPMGLIENGYMENVIQKAIDLGFEPAKAIQMATINVAEYFQLDGIIGGIAPGKYADILIIPDLETIKAEYVISSGKIITKEGNLLVYPRKHTFSPDNLNTVHLSRKFLSTDFSIKVKEKDSCVNVRVIDQITNLVTKELIISVPIIDGEIKSNRSKDLLKVAAIDRSKFPGKKFIGLIRGFCLNKGAVASSSAWDTSDIIVVGADEEDMAAAVNRICTLQGGIVVCVDGMIRAEIPLPVFGLMADMPMEALAVKIKETTTIIQDLGFPFDDPLRTLATITGAAIPFIRICEEGLVNIKEGTSLGFVVTE